MSDDDFLDDDLDPSIFNVVSKEIIPVKNESDPPNITKTKHRFDSDCLKTYIYPTNLQVRNYQYNIVQRALFHNVLVALPTGLGKTFIASTVMLNFLRWFPDLKIIFMAPTRPLVAQQVKACCGITGISSLKVAILLDKVRKNRASIWDSKQVFFATPQLVENDLTTGIIDPKLVVLLVIDEAHRARGNYAYNNVVKFLNRFNTNYRILALTATPASDVEGVQEIVNNLCISKVEVRTEKSIDIFPYLKRKTVERIHVEQSEEIVEVINLLCDAILPVLKAANQRKIYSVSDPKAINAFAALDAQQKIIRNSSIPEGLKWANFFILQLLIVVGQCLRRLNIYGIRSFYSYFHEKYTEFTAKHKKKKSTNQLAIKFYLHDSVADLLQKCENLLGNPSFLGHRKLEITIDELDRFFRNTVNADSRVIIFTEFRESALDIVRALENLQSMSRPHIFIGQAKEREKFNEEKFLQRKKKSKKNDDVSDDSQKVKRGKLDVPSSLERPMSSSEHAQVNGMNQKTQKELLKKFKLGEINVLVATSIGEEGLDIGEVDLIVCYDSTSSPIKNIQRMGRTGRGRDGKVILLFSSNEELKFDKAMGGYEYIQSHIMNGNMINLHNQTRVIPDNMTPVVDERFIEIPDENLEIGAMDDEDEIIKIASKYMTSKTPKSKALKSGKGKIKPGKVQKRFFMPDDVDIGFKLVSLMLEGSDEGREKRRKVRQKDILDTILDSDDESAGQDTHIGEREAKVNQTERENTNKEVERSDLVPEQISDPRFGEKFKEEECITSISTTMARNNVKTTSPTKTLGLRRGFDNILRSSKRVFKQPAIFDLDTRLIMANRSLGVRMRVPSGVSKTNDTDKINCVANKRTTQSVADSHFDNDDDEILALARSSSFLSNDQHSLTEKQETMSPGSSLEVKQQSFTDEEGFLTNEQTDELYMSYYVPTDAYALLKCYHVNFSAEKHANFRHGVSSIKLTRCIDFIANMEEDQAVELLANYEALSQKKQDPLGDFIDFSK